MDDEVLAVIEASAPRRWFGLATLAAMGVLVLYVAFSTPPAPAWQAFLIVMGAAALWMTVRMQQATLVRLELTETELRDSEGTCLFRVADMEALDRGFFAMKPSNGFVVRTASKGARVWRPGLWWRLGRRVGVGGVAAAHQTKTMSEILAAMLAERQMGG